MLNFLLVAYLLRDNFNSLDIHVPEDCLIAVLKVDSADTDLSM
jgi:hypothetical protein